MSGEAGALDEQGFERCRILPKRGRSTASCERQSAGVASLSLSQRLGWAYEKRCVFGESAVQPAQNALLIGNRFSSDFRNSREASSRGALIARALLVNPRLWILDEATSAIDPPTEACIQNALQTLLRGRTSFVIAHRLSTIRKADLIVVLEQVKIFERRTHSQRFAQAWLTQDSMNIL